MSLLAKLQERYGKNVYTKDNFELYELFRNKTYLLDNLLASLYRSTEIDSRQNLDLRRLGKIELLLSVKELITITNERLQLLGETT